jgi:hypothetical protein
MGYLHRRLAVVAALAATFFVVACNQPASPPPAPKSAPVATPSVDEPMKRLATNVYVYAFPLVVMDVTSQVQTAKVPANTFQHKRTLPDAATTDLADANPDVLSSQAWLDLAGGPVVLSLPDTHGRYYAVPMLDAWTNVFQSPGKRTSGTTKADFAIVGPKWKGELPQDVQEIKAPTQMVWLLGRIQSNGRSDDAAVAKIQDQFKLTPLSQWHRGGGRSAHPPLAAHANVDPNSPPTEQVAKMSAQEFFTRFAALLPGNPPAKEDTAVLDQIRQLGVVAGQPFDMSKLDAASARAIEEGARSALESIIAASKGGTGDLRNGWTIYWDLGRYGTNFGLRAVIAWLRLGADAPEDELLLSTYLDGGGRPLNGANRYVLHFDKGKAPPTDAFWSLAMYNDKHLLVANPLDRRAIGDRDKLKSNPDGSLDIYLQNQDPGKDKTSNWLPAPKENFNVILRVYAPKQEMLDRSWTPPAIQRLA